MKLSSTVYKGIEYIQIRELPPDQHKLLLQSINRDLLIKILVEGKLVGNCLQFKDYELWFDTVFKVEHKSLKLRNTLQENENKPVVSVEALKKI